MHVSGSAPWSNLRLRQLALIRSWPSVVFLLCVHETMTMIPASPLALVSCCSEDKTSNVSWWQQPLQTVLSAHAASSSSSLPCVFSAWPHWTLFSSFYDSFSAVWTKRIMVSYDDWPVVTLLRSQPKNHIPRSLEDVTLDILISTWTSVSLTLFALGSIGLARKFFGVFS